TPALVAVGDQDVPGFREMSAVLARGIPGAEYHVVAGAGHMASMEQPAAVNDLLTRFLARLAVPATAGRAGQAGPIEQKGRGGRKAWGSKEPSDGTGEGGGRQGRSRPAGPRRDDRQGRGARREGRGRGRPPGGVSRGVRARLSRLGVADP